LFKKIVFVVGMPRSGTSWLGQILDSSPQVRYRLSPLFSYAFKNAVDEQSSKAEYERMFHDAFESEDAFMSRAEERIAGHYPVFEHKCEDPEYLVIKMTRFHNLLEHMLEMFDNLSMLSIVRHPCGAIHSWLTTPREFPIWADSAKEWRTGACRKTGPEEYWGFEDWKAVTRLHMRLELQYSDRFTIVQYEALVEDPLSATKKVFHRLGLEYTDQTERFVRNSHRRHDSDPYAVFKDPRVRNRWKAEMDKAMQQEIVTEIMDSELARFLV